MNEPKLSIIVPIRGNPSPAYHIFANILETADHPEDLEIVLCVDSDDPGCHSINNSRLNILTVVFPPKVGFSNYMNGAWSVSTGRYLMLIPTDIKIKTKGWDTEFYKAFSRWPDDIAMVYPNDLIFKQKLATMPVVSRKACDVLGYMTGSNYGHHRVDDHIHHIYDLLSQLGHDRIVYLPGVVFEHMHYTCDWQGERVYTAICKNHDALNYLAGEHDRREAALKLAMAIDPNKETSYKFIMDHGLMLPPFYHCYVQNPNRFIVSMAKLIAKYVSEQRAA